MRTPQVHSLRLSADVWAALEAEADRAHMSLSTIVEQLVRTFLPELVSASLRERLSNGAR